MFQEFENIEFTGSSEDVTITDNTDFKVDEASKKIVFGLQTTDEYVDISFDEIDLSEYEEISFYLFNKRQLGTEDLFKITIDGNDYTFKNLRKKGWNHILIDCENMGSVSSIRITNLADSLVLFIDVIGARKVEYSEMDYNLLSALQNHISLDYGVSTTLKSSASKGSNQITLDSDTNIFNTTLIEISDGTNSEEALLVNNEGGIADKLENNYAAGTDVTALCPTLMEDYQDMEPDPVCGIAITDFATAKDDVIVKCEGSYKHKRFLGKLGITVYIDCSSKKKVLQMAREYAAKYGERFAFLLDGEQVDIYLEDSTFIDDEVGNLPRMSYFYRIDAQPVTVATTKEITTFNLTVNSEEP